MSQNAGCVRRFAAALTAVMLSLQAAASVAYTGFETSFGDVERNSDDSVGRYAPRFEFWLQGASRYGGVRNYGCRVVAQSKLVAECGAAYDGFDPDVYFDYGVANGHFDFDTMDEQYLYGSSGTCAVCFANERGVKLRKEGSLPLSGAMTEADAEAVQSLIENGKYVILSCRAHQAYVGRAVSRKEGRPIILDSWGTRSQSDVSCTEFLDYSLCAFTEAMYFSVEGEEAVTDDSGSDGSDEQTLEEGSPYIEETRIPEDEYAPAAVSLPRPSIVMLFTDSVMTVSDNDVVQLGTPPMIENERMYVPTRETAKIFGLTLRWDDLTNTARLDDGAGHTLDLLTDTGDVAASDGTFSEGACIMTPNDVSYVALRVLTDSFGFDLLWDDAMEMAFVFTNQNA